jgi:hypothetical protein
MGSLIVDSLGNKMTHIRKIDAMKERISEIVNLEHRAFSSKDLTEFLVDGQLVEIKSKVVRNYISKFKNEGEIISIGNSHYSIPGKKDLKAPLSRNRITEVIPEHILKKTPIYYWLLKQPVDKQALHDIRLTFTSPGIWQASSKLYPKQIDMYSKDVELPKQTYFGSLEFMTRVHYTDTVSLSVGCSGRPIAIETSDLLQFIEAITRTEMSYAAITSRQNGKGIEIPPFRSWIVKMWHFGIDLLNRYEEKEFHVTVEEGISDLYRIYTKRLEDGRDVIRLEHQEYPNQQLYDAILAKLYDDNGDLFDVS